MSQALLKLAVVLPLRMSDQKSSVFGRQQDKLTDQVSLLQVLPGILHMSNDLPMILVLQPCGSKAITCYSPGTPVCQFDGSVRIAEQHAAVFALCLS